MQHLIPCVSDSCTSTVRQIVCQNAGWLWKLCCQESFKQCIQCLQAPIVGELYTCLACARLQLCTACFQGGKHPQHSFSCCRLPGAAHEPACRDMQAALLTGLTCRQATLALVTAVTACTLCLLLLTTSQSCPFAHSPPKRCLNILYLEEDVHQAAFPAQCNPIAYQSLHFLLTEQYCLCLQGQAVLPAWTH